MPPPLHVLRSGVAMASNEGAVNEQTNEGMYDGC